MRNTFTYTATTNDMCIQIRQLGEYYVDNISISYPDTIALITQAPTPKNYRYGFNGMERDNEISGAGNSYDFGARMYNPRVGRFLSLDPLKSIYPKHSPYNFAVNNPIVFIDDNGEGPRYPEIADLFEEQLKKHSKYVSYIRVNTSTGVEFKIKAKVLGKTLYTTYVVNQNTSDYTSTYDLMDWGVPFYEAAIATSDSWSTRIKYKLSELDAWGQESPLNALFATATFIGSVATFGELSMLSTLPIKKWTIRQYGTVLGGLLAADDASPLFTGENKTALEKIGINEKVLNAVKTIKNTYDAVKKIQDVLKLKASSTYNEKTYKVIQGLVSALESTKNIVEWFDNNNKKNSKKRSKKWSKPSSKPSF